MKLPNANPAPRQWPIKVKLFRGVRFPGDWEVTIFLRWIQLRIGRSQVAAWWMLDGFRRHGTILNWCRRAAR